MSWPTQAEAPNAENQPKRRRHFNPLSATLTKSLEILQKASIITQLNPRSPPNPIPSTWRINENCLYHQVLDHNIDRCLAFRHRIQDLIEAGTILTPGGLNITNNPPPNHAPTAGMNALITKEEGFDFVCLITDVPVNRSSLPSPSAMRKIVSYDLNSLNQNIALEEEEELDITMKGLSSEPSEKTTQVTPTYNPLVSQLMAKMKFIPGQGLGKSNQGIPNPLLLTTNPGKTGLGFPPAHPGKGKKK